MATNTFASQFSGDAVSAYIAAKLLELAQKHLVLYGLMDHVPMPKGEGRTFQYTRYERVVLPQRTLTEGTTPGDTAMSIATVTAVMDQWGAVIPVSDVAIDSVKHPVLQQAIQLGGMQAAETLDREMVKLLLSGTNVYFPGAVTARGSLASTDKISSAAIGKIVANLRQDGAMPYDGKNYVGVLDPFGEDDVMNDSTFVNAAQYGGQTKLYNGEIGTWKGVRWMTSNTIPAIKLLTGGSAATSGTAGSLSNGTTYNYSFSVVDKNTGHETHISASANVATGAGDTSVDITTPALPADATAGSLFRIYFGTNGGTRRLAAYDVAASTAQNVGSVPSSGDVAPTSPANGFKTHFTFILGKGGAGCIEMNKIKAYLTPAVPSDSDPLVQRRKAGWKCDFKAVIKNEDFVARLEHATTNG